MCGRGVVLLFWMGAAGAMVMVMIVRVLLWRNQRLLHDLCISSLVRVISSHWMGIRPVCLLITYEFVAGLFFFTPHMTLESVSRRLNSSQSWQPGKTIVWSHNTTIKARAQWRWFLMSCWACRLLSGLAQRVSLYDLLLRVIILLLFTKYGICTWNCVYYGVLDAVKCIMMTTMYFANIIEQTNSYNECRTFYFSLRLRCSTPLYI